MRIYQRLYTTKVATDSYNGKWNKIKKNICRLSFSMVLNTFKCRDTLSQFFYNLTFIVTNDNLK